MSDVSTETKQHLTITKSMTMNLWKHTKQKMKLCQIFTHTNTMRSWYRITEMKFLRSIQNEQNEMKKSRKAGGLKFWKWKFYTQWECSDMLIVDWIWGWCKWKTRIKAKRQEHKTRNDNEKKGWKSETGKKYMRKY